MQTTLRYFRLLGLGTLTLSLMACGKGFQSTSLSSDGGSNIVNDVDGNPVTTEKAWSDVAEGVNGQVEGSSYDRQLVIQVDKARQALVIVLPLPSIYLLSLSGAPIPELPGASLEMITRPDGSMAMGVVIPLRYIIKGASFGDYGRLPNGDMIPFIPAGESRGFVINFPQKPKYRLHLYLAVSAVAVFVETPDFTFPSEIVWLPGFPVKNQARTQVVGYFQIIPNRGIYSSGVYVASRIPRQLAVVIDELLRF